MKPSKDGIHGDLLSQHSDKTIKSRRCFNLFNNTKRLLKLQFILRIFTCMTLNNSVALVTCSIVSSGEHTKDLDVPTPSISSAIVFMLSIK